VLPSGWTCLGLVQHLALDVERFWFREIVAGETIDTADASGTPSACVVPQDVSGINLRHPPGPWTVSISHACPVAAVICGLFASTYPTAPTSACVYALRAGPV
jgi:Protein of unknown function (DUF664)